MQQLAQYDNVVEEVKQSLVERANEAIKAGVYRWNIIIDPGEKFLRKK